VEEGCFFSHNNMANKDISRTKAAGFAEKISDAKYSLGPEIERTSKKFTRAMVPDDRPLRILDVGCGTGLNAQELAQKGHRVIGVDISAVAIAEFRKKGFDGCRCDIAGGVPFHEDSFDAVYASEVIEHLVDVEAFMKELYRVLRPRGQLVLSTVNSAFWVFRLAGLLGFTVSEIQHTGHLRFFSKSGLAQAVKQAGFEDIRVAGRHMYLIISGQMAESWSGCLEKAGFLRELRFRTQRPFWHVSRFSKKASPIWTDTLILTARKPLRQ